MNDFPLNLLLGMIAGFSVSMPLGPSGLLCIQRTLSKGQRSGLVVGMGAATSDVIYASLAILSLSFIKNLIENNKNPLFLISGLGLMIIGIAIYSTNPVKQLRQNRESKKFLGRLFYRVSDVFYKSGMSVPDYRGVCFSWNQCGQEFRFLYHFYYSNGGVSWFFIMVVLTKYNHQPFQEENQTQAIMEH